MTRKTIEQRISLKGGEEIVAQLRQIGDAGEQAFQQISDAVDAASTPDARLTAALNNFKSVFADTVASSEDLQRKFDAVGNSARKTSTAFRTMTNRLVAVAAGAGLVVAGLSAIAVSAANAAAEARETADSLGLAVDQFSRLKFAANQSSISDSQFTSGFGQLNTLLAEAKKGSQEAIDVLGSLNVAITDIQVRKGGKLVPSAEELRPTEQIINDIADAFARIPDGARKTAIAVSLFGEAAGPAFIDFLNQGSAAIEAQGDEAVRLGLVFTDLQSKIGRDFKDSVEDLGSTFQGLRNQIGIAFAPAVTTGIRAFTKIIDANRDQILDYTDTLIRTATPILEDFFFALSGDDNRVRSEWILDARDAIVNFATSVQAAVAGIIIPAFDLLLNAANLAAEGLNAIFGTDFTGKEVLIAAAVLQLVGVLRVFTSVVGLAWNSLRLLFALLSGPIGVAAWGVLRAGAAAAITAVAGLAGIPALVVAAVVGGIAAIVIYWDEIVAGAEFAWTKIVSVYDSIVAKTGEIFQSVEAKTAPYWDSFTNKAQTSLDAFVSYSRSAWDSFSEYWVYDWGLFSDGAQKSWAQVLSAATAAWNGIKALLDGAVRIWDRIREAGVSVWSAFREAASSAISFVTTQINRLKSAIDRVRSAIAKLRSARSRENTGTSAGDGASGFASGGRVRGPGTGTSDSILAWLSNDEWVIRAKAVRHYGHGVLAAINNLRLPKDVFKRAAPKFATGGPIRINPAKNAFRFALPQLAAFAAGGPVSINNMMGGLQKSLMVDVPRFAEGGMTAGPSGRPVTLSIGDQEFGPMVASEDVIDRLSRYAAQRQVASLGRKPGWYGN